MAVYLAKRALPKSLGGAPPPHVAGALAQLRSSFGQLGLASGEASLNIKALRGQPGLYRLRVGDWRADSCLRAKTSSSQRSDCARTSTSASLGLRTRA